jgi:tetratricopeptide (TPR) repeat protein
MRSNVVRVDVNVIHVDFTPSRKRLAYSLYAKACEIDDKDPKEGTRLYRRAIHLDPACWEAMGNLGRLYFKAGEFGAAENWWKRATRTNIHAADAYYNLGYLRLMKRDYQEAITYFEMAIGAEPYFANAYYNLGEALSRMRRSEEARACWRMHIKLRGEWITEASAAMGLRVVK